MRPTRSDAPRATLADLLGAARFVSRMSDEPKEREAWAGWLIYAAELLRARRRRMRRLHPRLGGGSIGDLCAGLSPERERPFDCGDRRDLSALSAVARVLAARTGP